ncbi:MAG: hypothetical protein ACO25F_09745 [Erythrobacter sp.]
MRRTGLSALVAAGFALAACGDSGAITAEGVGSEALQFVDETQVAELLKDEAIFPLGAYEQDIRGEILAYQEQFGRLPQSYAEIKSLAEPSAVATAAISAALAEQLPYVRRETLDQVSARFVAATQQRIFEQINAQEAAAASPEGVAP